MQISLLLMQQIAQLFLILLMGYAVVKTGLLKASDSKVLSVVFVYLVMPCVVLNAFQIKDTPEIRTGLLYSMGIAVGMHVVFLLLNALFRKALKLDAVEQDAQTQSAQDGPDRTLAAAQAVAKAVTASDLYVDGTLQWRGAQFSFETTTGVTCAYSPRPARAGPQGRREQR